MHGVYHRTPTAGWGSIELGLRMHRSKGQIRWYRTLYADAPRSPARYSSGERERCWQSRELGPNVSWPGVRSQVCEIAAAFATRNAISQRGSEG